MQVRRTFEATTYVALSAALGTISFFFLLVTLVVGVPMLIFALLGAPLIALAFVFCHVLARTERRRAAAMMGIEFPTRTLPREGSAAARASRWMRSRGSWLELCYGLIALPFVGWFGGLLVFLGWGAALSLLTLPAVGLGRRPAATSCSAGTSASCRARSCTSRSARARCTPRRGSRAASPPCRWRWRGCCSSPASASA